MATIPTGAIMTAQRCRQVHERTLLRTEPIAVPPSPITALSPITSPITSPECTPPCSPRKPESPLGAMSMNPLTKLSQLLHRRHLGQGHETDVGVSASGHTQSLEASHHTSSITSMT